MLREIAMLHDLPGYDLEPLWVSQMTFSNGLMGNTTENNSFVMC